MIIDQFKNDIKWALEDLPKNAVFSITNPTSTVSESGEVLTKYTIVSSIYANLIAATQTEELDVYSNLQSDMYSCLIPLIAGVCRDSVFTDSSGVKYNVLDIKTDAGGLYHNLTLGKLASK